MSYRDYRDDEEERFREDEGRNFRIIWECDKCKAQREEPRDCNEGGFCSCGGAWMQAGESYDG